MNFSEIGDYLDTAVKHYSSGMYPRLAFSVSAHLDAEIMEDGRVAFDGPTAEAIVFYEELNKGDGKLVSEARQEVAGARPA